MFFHDILSLDVCRILSPPLYYNIVKDLTCYRYYYAKFNLVTSYSNVFHYEYENFTRLQNNDVSYYLSVLTLSTDNTIWCSLGFNLLLISLCTEYWRLSRNSHADVLEFLKYW